MAAGYIPFKRALLQRAGFPRGDDFVKRRLVGSRQNGAMGAPLSPEGQRAGVCRVQRDGRGGAERRRGIEPLDGVSTRISPGRRALSTGYRRSV